MTKLVKGVSFSILCAILLALLAGVFGLIEKFAFEPFLAMFIWWGMIGSGISLLFSIVFGIPMALILTRVGRAHAKYFVFVGFILGSFAGLIFGVNPYASTIPTVLQLATYGVACSFAFWLGSCSNKSKQMDAQKARSTV